VKEFRLLDAFGLDKSAAQDFFGRTIGSGQSGCTDPDIGVLVCEIGVEALCVFLSPGLERDEDIAFALGLEEGDEVPHFDAEEKRQMLEDIREHLSCCENCKALVSRQQLRGNALDNLFRDGFGQILD
jgi:hypothetical protein